jgi:hypothetical protein
MSSLQSARSGVSRSRQVVLRSALRSFLSLLQLMLQTCLGAGMHAVNWWSMRAVPWMTGSRAIYFRRHSASRRRFLVSIKQVDAAARLGGVGIVVEGFFDGLKVYRPRQYGCPSPAYP